jgi:uncharacterized protein YbjT (DUF2867 family)
MTTLLTVVPERNIAGAVPTAPIARRLAIRLLGSGDRVRVLVPALEAHDWPEAVEVVIGDITQPGESTSAFHSIDRMFLAGASPDSVYDVVQLVEEGGVDHIVVLSSHGPELEVQWPPDSWYWLAIEVVVERSSAKWTHIRPSAVMASMLTGAGATWADLIRTREMIREAYVDARYPFIDEDDLAAVVVAAMSDDRYSGRVLEASGEPVSVRERIQIISEALGRDIPFEEISPDDAREVWSRQGWSEDVAEVSLNARAAFLAQPPESDPTVEQVLGRPPTGFERWFSKRKDEFR